MGQLKVNFMGYEHVPSVAKIEQSLHQYQDPDFGVAQFPDWCWDEDDVAGAVRQYKSKYRGTYETRAWVVTEEEEGKEPVVRGAAIYELRETEYQFVLLTADPKGPEGVRELLIEHVMKKAEQSDSRRVVSAMVRDGNYVTVKAFMQKGFKAEPKRDRDAWYLWKGVPRVKKATG